MSLTEEKLATLRHQMVSRQLRARGITDGRVLKAFADVPRHRFVPPSHLAEAYADYPIPIGCGQTISQPYVVALMVQELDVRPHHRVLDVGAGSGYQTAILAALADHVYAVERIEELTERMTGVLASLGVRNVSVRTADGSTGWPEEAPFDRIICGAASPAVPSAWTEQAAEGGRIVLPVGGAHLQRIVVVDKTHRGLERREVCDVRFVKLIGREGWPDE
jgi:protein-L-isoaspartate(D-aspartate) O-methyltransferase